MSEHAPWEIPSRLPSHPKTRAGIHHRARIAEFIKPLLVPGGALPSDKQIAAFLGLKNETNAGRHYSAVLAGLGVETVVQRRTVRVVVQGGSEN